MTIRVYILRVNSQTVLKADSKILPQYAVVNAVVQQNYRLLFKKQILDENFKQ